MAERPVIRAQRGDNVALGTIDLLGYAVVGDEAYVAAPLAYSDTPTAPEEAIHPTLTISAEAARQLLDDLLAAGVTPSTRENESPVIAAKDAHIADLMEVIRGLLCRPSTSTSTT